MESFEYWVPTRILFGKGAESKTAAEIQRLGARRVLIGSGGASSIPPRGLPTALQIQTPTSGNSGPAVRRWKKACRLGWC